MTTLQDIIKGIEKQNQSTQGLFGLTSLQGLAKALEQQQKTQIAFSGLSGLTEIARQISLQMKPFDIATKTMGNSIAHLVAFQPPKRYSALLGLTNSLSEIAKSNEFLSDKLSSLTANQLLLSNNLAAIAKSFDNSHLNKFNSLDIALQGISKSYLSSIAKAHNWNEISIVDEATETVANLSDELLSNAQTITSDDIDKLKESIITELSSLLTKTKTEKAKQFVRDFITLVAFLLIFYNPFENHTDKTNAEVIAEVESQIEKVSKGLSKQIEQELQKLNKTRVARTNVNLRKYPKKNTEIIGLVKSGQQVTVIEIRHKFLLIAYIDKETNEPKSGFVMKKYFDIEE